MTKLTQAHAYCALRPRGLGTTVHDLKNVCRDDIDATTLIDQAVQKPGGRPWKTGNNIPSLVNQRENHDIRCYVDCATIAPDPHAQVVAEEMSAHAAMIEAGFWHRTPPFPTMSTLARFKRHFGDELPALIAAVRRRRRMHHRDTRWRDQRSPDPGAKAATTVDTTLAAAPRMVIPRVPSPENDVVVIDRYPKRLMPTLQVEA